MKEKEVLKLPIRKSSQGVNLYSMKQYERWKADVFFPRIWRKNK